MMPTQLPIDFFAARDRRMEGMRSSAQHAEDEAPGWCIRAFRLMQQFAEREPMPWMVEQFRVWAEKQGLDLPPDSRAFGGVTQRAIRRGVIVKVGYAPAASSNGSPKPLYARSVKE